MIYLDVKMDENYSDLENEMICIPEVFNR